jgi:hypothetical protein
MFMSKLLTLLLLLNTPAEMPELKDEMNGMTRNLLQLIQSLRGPAPAPGSAEAKKIDLEFEQFKKAAHRISPDQMVSSTGKILPLLGRPLPDQADQAWAAWRMGQYDYARGLIRSTASACIECHAALKTNHRKGFSLPGGAMATLSPLDRSRFFRAIGRFEDSFNELTVALKSSVWESSDWYENEEILHELLSVGIRELKDPNLLLPVLSGIVIEAGIPKFLKSDLRQWIEDLGGWSGEKKSPKLPELLRRAFPPGTVPWDHKNEVHLLRAITALYARLNEALKPKESAELHFQLGRAFEILSPRLQETLHERFYEACIRLSPHSSRSEACYLRLERSVIQGFTGSSGTRLPEQEKKRLLELWGTAFMPGDFQLRFRK